eukprot:gene9594-9757_t
MRADPTVFREQSRAGWRFQARKSTNVNSAAKGVGVGGSTATCITLRSGGSVSWTADPDMRPFRDANGLLFSIRSNTKRASTASATPPGKIPAVFVSLANVGVMAGAAAAVVGPAILPQPSSWAALAETDNYCVMDIYLEDVQPIRMDGDYFRMRINLADFECGSEGTPPLQRINKIEITNPNDRNADICLDDIRLNF